MIAKIDKIGFEIEGEFSEDCAEMMADYGAVGTDGSVHTCNNSMEDGIDHYQLDAQEYRSEPFLRKEVDGKIAKIFEKLEKEYKDKGFHWNDSAGFHIHVSVKGDDGVFKAPELWSTDFCEYFTKRLAIKFPQMWAKRKNNRYCAAKWDDNSIIRPTDRYRAINYAAYNEHSTIEFRIFAADEPDIMYDYLLFTVETIEKFLETPLVKKFTTELAGEYKKRIKGHAVDMTMLDINLGEFKADNSEYKANTELQADGKKITRIL